VPSLLATRPRVVIGVFAFPSASVCMHCSGIFVDWISFHFLPTTVSNSKMPKVVNSRKFLKSVRQSSSPISSTNGTGGGNTSSTLSLAEHEQFSSMKSVELISVIKSRLQHPLPSERCVGADMISTFLTTRRLAQFKPGQLNELIKSLLPLLTDRVENVRFGAVDALW